MKQLPAPESSVAPAAGWGGRAKKLLAEMNYNQSKQITLVVNKAYGFTGAEDIAEAVAQMWRAVGVNVKLEPIEPATFQSMYKAFKLPAHTWLNGTGSDQWTGVTTYGSTQGSRSFGVELPEANKYLEQVGNTLDEKLQDEYWRKAGEVMFTQHKEIPMYWLPIEATVDPKVVADWVYPGSATGSWTHVENIKAAP